MKVKRWEKIFYANGNQKKAGAAIPISDKLDFKIKNVTRDKEGHYIMIKGSIQEEDSYRAVPYLPCSKSTHWNRTTHKIMFMSVHSTHTQGWAI